MEQITNNIKRIVAFGDSFTWGTELSDTIDFLNYEIISDIKSYPEEHKILKKHKVVPYSEVDHNHSRKTWRACYSRLTWPALLANIYNKDYECYAIQGSSNNGIARQIYQYLPTIDSNDYIIINWTYCDRWDIYNGFNESPENKWHTFLPVNNTKLDEYFYKNIYSEIWSVFNNLILIISVINVLKQKNINFIMTITDMNIKKKYDNESYIDNLQTEVLKYITWFDDLDFINWVSKHQYKVGKQNNHPLEEAHASACQYIKAIMEKNNKSVDWQNLTFAPIDLYNTYNTNYNINYDTK